MSCPRLRALGSAIQRQASPDRCSAVAEDPPEASTVASDREGRATSGDAAMSIAASTLSEDFPVPTVNAARSRRASVIALCLRGGHVACDAA